MCIVHVQAVMPYAYHLQKKKKISQAMSCVTLMLHLKSL